MLDNTDGSDGSDEMDDELGSKLMQAFSHRQGRFQREIRKDSKRAYQEFDGRKSTDASM